MTSYRNVRKHMRYETWWTVHLYTYLAAAIAFSHQLATGAPFLGHPLARAYWISLWLLTAGVVLCYRFGLPLVRSSEPPAQGGARRAGVARRVSAWWCAATTSTGCRSPAGSS